MDYSELAFELLEKMQTLRKAKPQKNINDALHGEAFVLNFIAVHGDEALPGEISQEMDVSSARIAQALNSIERKGWITREIDRNDRRKIIVRLTAEGKTEADKHQRFIVGLTAKMLSLLGEEDAKEYIRITSKLAELLIEFRETLEI